MVSLKITIEGEWIFILETKLKHYTKEASKIAVIVMIGFLLILASIFIKFKPVYEVTIDGEKLGVISNLKNFKNLIEEKIINQEGTNIANISSFDLVNNKLIAAFFPLDVFSDSFILFAYRSSDTSISNAWHNGSFWSNNWSII